MTLDVRLVLETHDGALIGMTYRGLRHGPAAAMDRLNRGEAVDPSEYYFRTAVAFETAAPQYDWLNRVIAMGTGRRPPEGPVYDVFEVLEPWPARKSDLSGWAIWARPWRPIW
jgi:hypothetical protein